MTKIFAQNVNKLPFTVGTDNDAVEKLVPLPPSMYARASLMHTNTTIIIHPANVEMLLGEYVEFILLSMFCSSLCANDETNAFQR